MRRALAVAALASVALTARPADACSLIGNEAFVVEPGAGGDTTAPGGVTVVASSLVRTDADNMCGYAGVLSLTMTARDEGGGPVGFRVDAVEGTIDEADTPIVAGFANELVFYLWDLDPAYVLDVSAVDHAGNVGPTSRLTFTTPPEEGGCSTGGAGSSGAAIGVAFAVAGLARRRRR